MTRIHLLVPFLVILAAPPALAQEAEEGPGLIERGLALLFDGVEQEMQPHLDDMAQAMQQLGPALDQLLALVDDMTNYEMPVMLENGDILIRRKPAAPQVTPPADQGIEL